MSTDINQLRDFSALFTRGEILRLLKDDFDSVNKKLERYGLIEKNHGSTYLKLFKQGYKKIQKGYQNEYVVKNEFLNKILISQTENRSSVVFNEVRLGDATGDLAIFNGISKVFEIKTILDKEYRLKNQIETYKKLFNEIYIIVPKENVDKYLKYDNTVAVISYDEGMRNFNLERKAETFFDIDINVLMNVLHTKEYISITKKYYKEVPEMNAFDQFDICKELISEIPVKALNDLFVDTMKNRNIKNSFFDKINNEFNQICLSLNFSEEERKLFIDTLRNKKVG